MSRIVSRAVAGAAALCVLLLSAAPAWSHEQRPVSTFQLTVGWQHEPTYVGVENAVQLFIKDAKGTPIDDLGTPPSLHVTVSTGTRTSDPLELKASWDPDTGLGTHGEFDAAVIPTTPGTYTFHFTGSINGQKVDEKFTSSEKTFDDVKVPAAIEFPNQDPTNGDLATNLTRLNPRVDNALALGKSAHDKASSASTLAVVALIVGVVVGGAGLVVGLTRGRRGA
ncbi:MAG: hypothetical protein ACYDH6_04565 [Acidimicrobiales bacterium]